MAKWLLVSACKKAISSSFTGLATGVLEDKSLGSVVSVPVFALLGGALGEPEGAPVVTWEGEPEGSSLGSKLGTSVVEAFTAMILLGGALGILLGVADATSLGATDGVSEGQVVG